MKGTAVHRYASRWSQLISLVAAIALVLAFPLLGSAKQSRVKAKHGKPTPVHAAKRPIKAAPKKPAKAAEKAAETAAGKPAEEKQESTEPTPAPTTATPRPAGSAVEEIPVPTSAKQEEKGKAKKGVEEIVVTGSRVKTTYEGMGPVTTLSSDDLDLAGEVEVADLLKERPSLDFTGTNRFDTNGGRGRNTIGLRGLGSGRTLILVNGRRFVQSSNGASDAVDLSVLATGLIQDIEILRDGVSTIYGADAVAGVINIRTRTNLDGLRFRAGGGFAEEGSDSQNGDISLLWGKNFENGNITFGGSHSRRQKIQITDRNSSRSPIFAAFRDPDTGAIVEDRDTFSFPQGIAVNPNLAGTSPARFTSFNPDGTGRDFRPLLRDPVTGLLNLDNDQQNINSTFPLSDAQVRSTLSGQFNYEFADRLEAFTELSYSRIHAQADFSPTFLGGGSTVKNQNGFLFTIRNPLLGAQATAFNNPFLPPGFVQGQFNAIRQRFGREIAEIPLILFKGFDEFGQRIFQEEVDTQRAILGLRGSLPGPLDDVDWEVSYNYGKSKDSSFVKNEVNFTNALASIQPSVCAMTPGCVVGDFFGVNGLQANTPGALNFIRYKSRDDLSFHLKEWTLSAKTTVLKLPAGDMRMSIGAEFRTEDGEVDVDPVALNGDSGGLARSGTKGTQRVQETFFEADIPLFQNLFLLDQLSVNISGRYTSYNTFGGRYLSRYAVSYGPFKDLRLRGVYSTSFRSPSISDLFLGPADSFVSVSDPCDGFPNVNPILFEGCKRELTKATGMDFTDDMPFGGFGNQSRQVRSNIGGNKQLGEETADNVTLGFVYTPSWMSGANLALDYYDIEVDNPVVGQSPQFRVNNCVVRNQQSECDAQQRDSDGNLIFVDVPRTNFGQFRTRGLDFATSYIKTMPFVGPTRFSFEGVYTYDFTVKTFNGKTDVVGLIGGASGGLPRMKGFFDIQMNPTEELTIETSVEYLGGNTNFSQRAADFPFDKIRPVMYVDAGFRYQITDRVRFTLSAQNLFNKRPPLVIGDSTFTNTNTSLYDPIRRRYFATVSAEF